MTTVIADDRGRYETLDAWRALAALAVVVFHCVNRPVTPSMGTWARVLLFGWAGVFVFFPISGYCILAALLRSENATLPQFLRRRWRRIVPPYWASLLVVIGVALAAAPFNHYSVGYLNIGTTKWLSVLTLTQVWVDSPAIINPVYWTLCYEEQFYLVMALTLLAPANQRLRVLLAVTLIATAYCSPAWPGQFRAAGLFLGYWLSFASGLAAFVWLRLPQHRWWAVTVFGCATVTAIQTWDIAVLISGAAALIFIVLAPYDHALARTKVGAALISVGLFSYSLYLVHVPIGGRVVNGLLRLPLPFLVPSAVAVGVSLVAGWCFHVAVERRFLNAARAAPAAPTAPAVLALPWQQVS
jgi:peptidoglycan/LPS O-acetylase OafA/YrhL